MAKTQPNDKKGSFTLVRRIVQWMFLFVALIIGFRDFIPSRAEANSIAGAIDAVCPMGGMETLLAYFNTGQTLRTTSLFNFAVLVGVLAVSVIAGRAFCGWICPLGTLQDMLAGWAQSLSNGGKSHIRGKRSKAKFPIELSPKVDKWARYLKYLILAVVLFASTKAIYPPLREICPARALFSFELREGLLISVLVVFIITSLLVKRFWCKYLCPLGAALAIFNRIAPLRVVINKNNCTNCGRCQPECPMDIPAIPENMRSLECIQCLECVDTCVVEDAIVLKLG